MTSEHDIVNTEHNSTAGAKKVLVVNSSGNSLNLALESGGNLALIKAKTDNLDTALSGIKTGTDKIPSSPSTINDSYPVGTGSNGTVTLTNATTAYSVPATASTKNHILVVYNGSDTDMYWGYATLTTGGILLASGATTSISLGANQNIFMYCGSAGKVVNYTYKEATA